MPAVPNAHTIVIGPTYADVERPKRPIADVQSPQAEVRTLRRRDTRPGLLTQRMSPSGPDHAHRRDRSSKSAFLTCDDGNLQYHRPGARPGESSSQAAARNERERIQRLHRSVRRDSDAQSPSLTPTTSDIYARDHRMPASPMLQQSGGPDLDDVFAPTSAQPRESISPSARSSQY
ncbi:uncharacterized protein CPUR_07587 [Claviceps purpurea 20.1]|uniref:Uncharacterized protein n=1 Tax=Claviceps purpurea (strain 20.1) TaxID=1111077 RepID=M1W4Q3_CLAP2|nr:uncharacterized protein CPUR_07587 [Claviceps purpurea 20.1]